jgi:hypothetical protein
MLRAATQDISRAPYEHWRLVEPEPIDDLLGELAE